MVDVDGGGSSDRPKTGTNYPVSQQAAMQITAQSRRPSRLDEVDQELPMGLLDARKKAETRDRIDHVVPAGPIIIFSDYQWAVPVLSRSFSLMKLRNLLLLVGSNPR
ncbi:hypothetical protein N7535_007437 [Penicillium sp. DV-2018c]|nr:hypothetical protein N7461_003465 [Penicillium sp. DV-2018c]KAJ5565799.1 hypothetical protein N7535_007437 [Penicillium sp. DV-2018c]